VTSPIRGNVETRLEKVARGDHDATVLALAGLRRLGLTVADVEILSFAIMLPAPGQGAIAVQCRADDTATCERFAAIDHPATRAATDAEREVLRLLGGSCALALGALGRIEGADVVLDALLDGRRASARGRDALAVALEIAADLGVLHAV
jgi:hydroxymethylbilane synthase